MRLACAILLLVGARAAGVAPAETLASAVPAEKKNPIDAVEATYGRVKRRWRDWYTEAGPARGSVGAGRGRRAEEGVDVRVRRVLELPYPAPSRVLSNTVTISPARAAPLAVP